MTEQNDPAVLRAQLEEERRKVLRLRRQSSLWQDLTRRAVQAKVDEARQRRDLSQVLGEMRQHLEQEEQRRDAVARTAQAVIDAHGKQLARIAEQCKLWRRGELDTMTTIAGICGEMGGHPLPDPGEWERRRAVLHAELLSQHRELTDVLAEIERVLEGVGVPLTGTHVQQVQDLVQLYAAANDEIDEWKTEEARARGAAMQLLEFFGHGGTVLSGLLQAGQYDQVLKALREESAGEQE